MDILLEKIEKVVERCDEFDDEGATIFDQSKIAEELTRLIDSYELRPSDWKKYAHFDANKYTRNLIAVGKNKRFGLMILAWGPGQKSAIHDHNGSHCIMRVLEGTLTETLYTAESGMDSDSSLSPAEDESQSYKKKRESTLITGQTAYIHDNIGWHRVSNASQMNVAVSLHLYAPPIERCKTFCEVEGKVRAQAACPYYSIGGKLTQYK